MLYNVICYTVIQLYMQIIWMFIWMVVIQRHEHWTFQKQLVIAQV